MLLCCLSVLLFKTDFSNGKSVCIRTEVSIQQKPAKEAKRNNQHSLFLAIHIDTIRNDSPAGVPSE